jgi:hypothetical protein
MGEPIVDFDGVASCIDVELRDIALGIANGLDLVECGDLSERRRRAPGISGSEEITLE